MAYRYNENTMTDTKQPEALRLADAMERFTKSSHWWTDGEPIHIAVAAELRRLQSENEQLRAGYDAARREIESLQAQAQQCGAGAGCCAQAARIEALQAQLEAVGAPQPAAQDDLGYQAACSLATRLFKKHFSKDVEYASGKVTWGLCDTTAGVISQIDNMVFWLVEPAAQAQPVATIYVTEDGSREAYDWKVPLPVGATTLYTAPQPPAQALDAARVFWQQHTQADALSMEMAELHADAERVIRAALAAPAQPSASERGSRSVNPFESPPFSDSHGGGFCKQNRERPS